MNEHSTTMLPGANTHRPHVETGVIEHLTPIEEAQRAAQEAERVSTNTKPEDRGIHRTKEDLQEEELKAAGWVSMSAHPRSAVWRSPAGVLMPGPGYAWNVMKGTTKV